MKLTYFLESDASKCCPPNFLKKGYRVRWEGDGTLMFGRVVSVSGNTVTVTDEKFGTDEKHTIKRDQVFEVLTDPEAGSKQMKVIWAKNKYTADKKEPEVTKVEKAPVAEALDYHIERNRVNFKDDREVEELVLTRLDPHDIAELIMKVAVLNAYVEVSKEVEKDQDARAGGEPEDFEGETPKALTLAAVAERADEIASDYARLVKERVSEARSGSYGDLAKHYFADLK